MNWKFWKRSDSGSGSADTPPVKLPGPKEIPQQIGMYLVVQEKQDPDDVWNLRCVVRPRPEKKRYFDFRVFSPGAVRARQVRVVDYTSLDNHPDLILYKGRYCKDERDPELDRTPPLHSAA